MQPISLAKSAFAHQCRVEAARLSRRASRLLSSHQHVLLKALPTAGGYAFGDCLTQQLGPLWPTSEWPSKHSLSKHDLNKTAAMAAVGATVGAPLSLAMYAWMDRVCPGAGLMLAAAKFTLDQVVGCVLWQAAYMCISEPYRRTFGEFASAHMGSHKQHLGQCHSNSPAGCFTPRADAMSC